MTTYIIINSIVLTALAFACFKLYVMQKTPSSQEKQKLKTDFDWRVKTLLILAFLIILLSFILPFILTRPAINGDFDFTNTGQVGDTIGGLMNPFVALAGVIVTGLAFYIQYKANLLQRELFNLEQEENKKQLQQQIDNQNTQIKIQQFESQFYEMLKLHRENVTEMKINGYDFDESNGLKKVEKSTDGRKVFVTMQTEFESILSIYTKDNKLDKKSFQKCYKLFFSGLDEFVKAYPDEKVLIELLKKARNQHEHPVTKTIKTNEERKEFLPHVKLYFNYKPYSGHASRLGHYFRHLYLTVKSVAKSDIITDYDDRMKYLRILRAQLSNHEQILLFYNWLSEYGYDWENNKHSFLTEYCMIHNLWFDNLFQNSFITENVDFLRKKEVKLRKGPMYEID
jgi:hypothetical protein